MAVYRFQSFAILLAFGAAGCTDAATSAEQELAIVEKSGDPGQVCAARRKVADAYLKQRDEKRYAEADLSAKITCRRAEQLGFRQ